MPATLPHWLQLDTPSAVHAIPPEVREAYGLSDSMTVAHVAGGRVNHTLLIHDGDEMSILQRLGSASNTKAIKDAQIVSDYLQHEGWESPSYLPAQNGEFYAQDNTGSLWRRLQYIPSDGVKPSTYDAAMAAAAGELLGSWHQTIAKLSYVPQFEIPHLHDIAYHAHKLEECLDSLPGSETQSLAKLLLASYEALPTTTKEDVQLIHGDPKLDNMLFRDGRPFTLIDLDDMVRDSVWTDVGDFLRSFIGHTMQAGQPIVGIKEFVTAYHQKRGGAETGDEAYAKALQATTRISVELGMRYLYDIVEADYFSWDQNRYNSRSDNHYARASLQLSVAKYSLALA